MQHKQLDKSQAILDQIQPTANHIQPIREKQHVDEVNISKQIKKINQNQIDQQSNTLIFKSINPENVSTTKNYGNYIVFVDNSYISIMIGPDYLCFLPTFLFFAAISYFLLSYINANVQNIYAIVATYIVCGGQTLSFLLIALSDPGIAHPLTPSEILMTKTSFCRKCRFNVPEKTFHCNYCNVCIKGYDHHCPWTSKCIGKQNLIRFYIFLFMTPIFIVYCAFAFGFTLPVSEHHKMNNNLKKIG